MNKSSTNNGNKSRSSPSPKKATKKRRQRSSKGKTIGGFPVNTVAIPVAISSNRNNNRPRITSDSDGTRVRRTELISTNLKAVLDNLFSIIARFRCNPGSQKTFPWLSTFARCFESYKFHSLKFHFLTRVPTSLAGMIYLSPDYDAADAAPSEEVVLANNVDTKESSVYRNLTVSLHPQKMNRLYKAHAVMDDSRFDTTTQDEKTIDCAQLFIGVETFNNVVLGKLMVEYDVSLYEPQQPFIPLSQGGALSLGTTFIANSVTPFNTAPVLQNTVNLSPLIENADVNYPSANLGKFTRDFQGFMTNYFNANQPISAVPNVKLNGVDSVPTFTTPFANQMMTSSYINAKAGDLLGLGSVSTVGGILDIKSILGATGFLA